MSYSISGKLLDERDLLFGISMFVFGKIVGDSAGCAYNDFRIKELIESTEKVGKGLENVVKSDGVGGRDTVSSHKEF